MNIEQRVTKSLVGIMMSPDWGFLGGVLKTGKLIPDTETQTIKTDGVNVLYNPEWLDNHTNEEINFILLHEGLHKAYQHMHLWEGLVRLDKKKADRAMDLVVNSEIVQNSNTFKVTVPYGYEINAEYNGMSTPQVFHLIEAEESGDNNDDQPGSGSGADEHQHGVGLSPADSNELDLAIRQAAGMLPANRARALQNALAVKRDWKELLQAEWSTTVPGKDDTSWSRVNTVYLAMGFYLPGTVSMAAKHVNFCIDTSGSITEEVIAEAASEVAYLASSMPPESLDIIWWDTDAYVQSIDPSRYNSIREDLEPMGGGGTDPSCLDEFMSEDNITIILTDGYFSEYTPPQDNTIFLVVPGGTTSYIKKGTIIEM
jgi:predicted metal-dependent peptidase